MKEVINIGVIGFGIVGSGAVKILTKNADSIAQKVGSRLNIKKIADLDITTDRGISIDKSVLTTDANEVLNDPEIDIVIETIGGLKPAGDFIKRAIENGKHVATANKELIAKEGADLLPLAEKKGVDLMFEASVGGGIPIIRPMKECLAGNEIIEIKGIVNGTTNYILTRMREEGLDFSEVLADAQAKGYAEADPTADVEGHDAAYKISILASIAFMRRADVSKVYHEGITKITAEDMKYADELGYCVKLLAIANMSGGKMIARVHPALIKKDHALASVNGVMNAVFVTADAVDEVMFYGPGAGSMAAGSAIVGDVIDIARNINFNCTSRIHCTCFAEADMLGMDAVKCRHYLRMLTADRPRVLAQIANVLADNHVSIESVIQKGTKGEHAQIVWLTHEAPSPDMKNALSQISDLEEVSEVSSWIRVVD